VGPHGKLRWGEGVTAIPRRGLLGGQSMTWVLNLDTRARGEAIARAICASGRDLRLVDAPDPAELTGLVVCSRESSDLRHVLAAATDSHVIVVIEPRGDPEPWSILATGAADLMVWDDDPAPIHARLRRLHEVEQTVESALVSEVVIGRSPALRQAMRDLVTAARFGNGPILILGETGTGKELAARVAHSVSPASQSGELVTVDCTTIVPTLSGSELFGHERGAFTGAVSVRTGACAAADGGTLFLDEVGELSPQLQPELLRMAQEGTYKRVGGDKWLRSRFRLICATNRSLPDEVAAGRFRADFYYRVAATTVTMPSLRQRPEDVIPLFMKFFAQAQPRPHAERIQLTPAVADALQRRDYPGNLRDLRQLAHRVAARHVGVGPITPGDLPAPDRPSTPLPPLLPPTSLAPVVPVAPVLEPAPGRDGCPPAVLAELVRALLRDGMTLKDLREQVADLAVATALEQSGGNVRAAAAKLGITDRALHLRRAQQRAQTRAQSRVAS
jgi:transcriptional regulator with GAF, ATPase, and Fis domain